MDSWKKGCNLLFELMWLMRQIMKHIQYSVSLQDGDLE